MNAKHPSNSVSNERLNGFQCESCDLCGPKNIFLYYSRLITFVHVFRKSTIESNHVLIKRNNFDDTIATDEHIEEIDNDITPEPPPDAAQSP